MRRAGRRKAVPAKGSAGVVIAADLVADAADGTDERALGTCVDFFAEIVDVDIHDVGDGVAVHAPDFFDYGDTRNRAALIAKKKIEQ